MTDATAAAAARRDRFRALHAAGTFVMPNPWDVGSAKLLASLGFPALATTSAGLAWSLGHDDYGLTRDELLTHVAALASAVDVPLNVDSERCFADTPAGVAETVGLLADAGAAGCSIEDWNPATDAIDPLDVAVERAGAAADAARRRGVVLTARCENLIHGVTDLDDTIARLQAYRDAGAEVVYAPGPADAATLGRIVAAVGVPVNALARPGGASVPELAAVGVRRVSTGGSVARAAYGTLLRAGRELLGPGTSTYLDGAMTNAEAAAAFDR